MTLIELLKQKYQESVQDLDIAPQCLADAESFLEFAARFLDENPVVSTYPVARGLGVVFGNNDRVTFCKQDGTSDGDILHAGAVAITQPGAGGMALDNAIPVTGGKKHEAPKKDRS